MMAGPPGPDSPSLSSESLSSLPSSELPSSSSQSDLHDLHYVSGMAYPSSAGLSISRSNFIAVPDDVGSALPASAGLPSKTSMLGSAATATGQKLKRVLRRKRVHDTVPMDVRPSQSDINVSRKGSMGLQLGGQIFGAPNKHAKHTIDSLQSGHPSPPPTKVASPPPRKHSLDPKISHEPSIPSPSTFAPLSQTTATAGQCTAQDSHGDPATTTEVDKETWRKSDSTMSHHTIRPTVPGSRTPRPGSIVATLQEDDCSPDEDDAPPVVPIKTPKSQRSKSLNLPVDTALYMEHDLSMAPPPPHRAIKQSFTERNRSQEISPPPFEAESSVSPHHKATLSVPINSSGRTGVANSLAPAVGLAKRAVERMGRAWGGFSPPTSFPNMTGTSPPRSGQESSLSRVDSNLSHSEKKKQRRRTPNSTSGTWSIGSSANNSSESESFSAPSGPYLGTLLRGPIQLSGSLVFGRPLHIVVKETGLRAAPANEVEQSYTKGLESRSLPAVIIRCAQHLSIWGIQEEGLFRVNGRPSHVSKLRYEFDKGADYDMMECSPGQLDPHAVAGVFKAFLRELPEPILTHSLAPYFEAAVVKENEASSRSSLSGAKVGGRGPTLPSGPRTGIALRKPPSLSTLAMPDLHSLRKPSAMLIRTLRSLVTRLPQENRDLLQTVSELIRATAKESRVTKMPLSNLLVVFCPSLHMNPPLLRALTECPDVWSETPESPTSATTPQAIEAAAETPLPADIAPSSVVDVEHSPPSILTSPADADETTQVEDPKPLPFPTVVDQPPSLPLIDVSSPKTAVRVRPVGPRKQSPTTQGSPLTQFNGPVNSVLGNSSTPVVGVEESASEPNRFDLESVSSLSASSSSEVALLNEPVCVTNVKGLTMHTSPSAPVLTQGRSSHSNHLKGLISAPIPFPSTDSLNISQSLRPRRSFPTLSLPTRGGSGAYPLDVDASSSPSSSLRSKRPSLSFLWLPNRSASPSKSSSRASRPVISNPIIDPSLSPPHTHSSSNSVSSDASSFNMLSISQSTAPFLPPVLDSPTASGSLGFDQFSFDTQDSDESSSQAGSSVAASYLGTTPSDSTGSGASPSSSFHARTPIANLYQVASAAPESSSDSAPSSPPAPFPQARSVPGRSGRRSPLQLMGLSDAIDDEDEDDDDWTKTIMLTIDPLKAQSVVKS